MSTYVVDIIVFVIFLSVAGQTSCFGSVESSQLPPTADSTCEYDRRVSFQQKQPELLLVSTKNLRRGSVLGR